MATDNSEYPPYTPMPSLHHELGLLFGFLSLCIVVMGVYTALWRVSQTRLDAQDLARRKAFRAKAPASPDPHLGTFTTIQSPGGVLPCEKMLDRYAMPENRVELPVHGMDLYASGKGVSADDRGGCGVIADWESIGRI
ncbi:hypothetical protein N7457_004323 [Penicillium paradoxum]|uniref:uncharacterized protein n=1 Tax=Penicillium paradoxum TaxID=176176 RepID=UPI0025467BAF|nr:uncharacterized protein N7457_004323 [Penicillium paradoxum]KAJ5782549.1 hypothetical protein N7457_004323 [Penicillium paradoxum]